MTSYIKTILRAINMGKFKSLVDSEWVGIKVAATARAKRLGADLPYGLAGMLPKALVTWVFMRVAIHASTGKWSHVELPALTVVEALARWKDKNAA